MFLNSDLPKEQYQFMIDMFNVNVTNLENTPIIGFLTTFHVFIIGFTVSSLLTIIYLIKKFKNETIIHKIVLSFFPLCCYFSFIIIFHFFLGFNIYNSMQSKSIYPEKILYSTYIQSLQKEDKIYLANLI